MASADAVRAQLEKEVQTYRGLQQDIQKFVQTRTQLISQLNENDAVLEELRLLSEDASVFKMVGPALVKQDMVEARSNVGKRLEYIKGEVERVDGQIKSLEGKVKERENEIMKLQSKMPGRS